MGPHLGKLVNMHTLNLACTRCDIMCRSTMQVCDCSCFHSPLSTDNSIRATGWRRILQSLAHVSNIKTLVGLKYGFIRTTKFDPADTLRDLHWPVDLLHRSNPESAILQFCREMSHGVHNGDPVASMLLLGPGGAGKSTLLHRLQTGKWNPDVKSTDGLRVGASRACKVLGIGV